MSRLFISVLGIDKTIYDVLDAGRKEKYLKNGTDVIIVHVRQMATVETMLSLTRFGLSKRAVARRWMSAIAFVCVDVMAFLCGYYLLRAGHQMPMFLLPESRGVPNFGAAADAYLILGIIFIAIRYFRGDYSKRQLFWDSARDTTNTLAFVAIPDVILVVLVGGLKLYVYLVSSWLFVILAVPLFRQAMRYFLSAVGVWQTPTALLGMGQQACLAYKALDGILSLGFDIRYAIIEDSAQTIPSEMSGLAPINLENVSNIAGALHELDCSQVIVTEDDAKGRNSDIVQRLIGADIEVAVVPALRGLPLFGMSTNYVFGQDMLLLQLRNNLAGLPSRIAKRIADILGAIFLVALFAPLWLVIAVAIKMHDGGSVFFVQRRVGRKGGEFGCIKFRTMAVDANERLLQWKQENPELYAEYLRTFKLQDDPRITRLGKWLRRTSMDELPQLINVFAGEMSLVGPRPVVQQELREYYGPVAELYKRVNPGLTGLWQVSGRSDTTYASRIAFDEWYILNWSLWYDLVILLQTVWVVISGKGAV